jgi:phosphate transport system substrate-binding protein
MLNSNKWNWDVLTEFVDKPSADAEAQIGVAVANDPDGIGVAAAYSSAPVKAIPLAQSADQSAVAPTTESVGSRTYPLARPVFAYIDQNATKPLNPLVLAFMNYILSVEGKGELKKSTSFLPLPEHVMKAEIERLSASQAR